MDTKFRVRTPKYHSTDNGSEVLYCRREFKLLQQFPSTVQTFENSGILRGKCKMSLMNVVTPKKVNLIIPNKEAQGKISKLRIKLQDGRDLGEIKAQFLSPKKELNDKTNTFKKLDLSNKQIMLALSPFCKEKKLLNNSPVKSTHFLEAKSLVVPSKMIPSKDISCQANTQTAKIEDRTLITPKKSIILVRKNYAEKPQCKEHTAVRHTSETTTLQREVTSIKNSQSFTIKSNDTSQWTKLQPNKNNDVERSETSSIKKCTSKTACSPELECTEKSSTKTASHLQLVDSKYPIVKCEKLNLSNPKTRLCSKTDALIRSRDKLSKSESFLTVKSTKQMQECSSSETIPTNLNNKRKDCSQSCDVGSTVKRKKIVIRKKRKVFHHDNQCRELILETNLSTESREAKRNETTSRLTSEKIQKQCKNISTNNCNESSALEDKENSEKHNSSPKNVSIYSIDSTTTNDSPSTNKQEVLSSQWSIITEAVNSVKDEQLRAKALKALADCGIGIERHVPITSPPELKVVHDIQIQTEVFGLLDSESFVLVREDKPNIHRIQQTEGSLPTPEVVNLNIPSQQTNNHVHLNSNNILLGSTAAPQNNALSDTLDIDNFFDMFFNENKGANKVKEVLSEQDPVKKKICSMIQADFEAMKKYDDNGMLNIHREVMNNSYHNVQRLLMILKASKLSVDVPTEDGMTSLELAVKSNASLEIIKLLLEAGAQPVLPMLLHNSALIIASKMSNPCISQLVKYVKNPKLLDQVDSTGFAPLHHCALVGNEAGITALIKAGANVNLRNSCSGRTSFFLAVENNHVAIAQKLLDNGAIANIPNYAGQTVLCLVNDMQNLSLKSLGIK